MGAAVLIVLDSSALASVLLGEDKAAAVARAIDANSPRLLSAANLLETAMVVASRKGEAGGRELDLLLYRIRVDIVPVDQDQAELARIAWRRFGRGHHPAALNYGDCFAYALAKSRRAPLLFVGGDFGQTDIESVPLV
jgi:ribonuclease VapC